jgi:hypothetical protein
MSIQMRPQIGYTEMIIMNVDIESNIHSLQTFHLLRLKVHNIMFLHKFTLCLFNTVYIHSHSNKLNEFILYKLD